MTCYQLAKDMNVDIIWVDLPPEKFKGYYVKEKHVIMVNQNLDEIDTENVIYHELEHAKNGDCRLSCHSAMRGYKQEAKANRKMIARRIREWLEACESEEQAYFDISRFLAHYRLDSRFYDMVEREALKIMEENKTY